MRKPLFGALLALSLLPGVPAVAETDVRLANWQAPPLWRPSPPAEGDEQGRRAAPGREVDSSLGLDPTSVPTAELVFVGITPCRLADTRSAAFPAGYGTPFMPGSVQRDFVVTTHCGIPATAQAVSFNFTVTDTAGAGFLLVYPAGGARPTVSTLNYLAGQTIANAAVVPLGSGGALSAFPGVSGFNLIIDVNGYYAPGTGFVPLSGGTMTGELLVGPAAGAQALSLSGDRSAGAPFTAPVALVTNNNASSTAAPALRLVNASPTATSTDGVLSVSNAGGGLLARFGNSCCWVTDIDASGNISTSGSVSATGNLSTAGDAAISGDLTARNMPGADFFSYNPFNSFSTPVAPGASIDVIVPALSVSVPASASWGVLLLSGTLQLVFSSPGYSGTFCANVDLLEGATYLTTSLQRFGISTDGATSVKVQYAAAVPPGAATRTFQMRVGNCMSGTTASMYANARTLSAIYLPVRY